MFDATATATPTRRRPGRKKTDTIPAERKRRLQWLLAAPTTTTTRIQSICRAISSAKRRLAWAGAASSADLSVFVFGSVRRVGASTGRPVGPRRCPAAESWWLRVLERRRARDRLLLRPVEAARRSNQVADSFPTTLGDVRPINNPLAATTHFRD